MSLKVKIGLSSQLIKEAKFNAIEEERTITADLNSLPPSTTDLEGIEQTHSVVLNSLEYTFDLRFECEIRNDDDLEKDDKEGGDSIEYLISKFEQKN
jgi:hypothetical protein